MKNWSKRNKILFGVIGAVVVLVVVGLVLGLTGNLPLQGGLLRADLTPNSVCLQLLQTQTFTLKNWQRDTQWNFYGNGAEEVSRDRTHFTIQCRGYYKGCEGYVKVFGPSGAHIDTSYFGSSGMNTYVNCP